MSRVGARDKVERAALDLFATKGVDGASIAEIAAAAGVSQGALYRHFPSKDALAWSLFSTAYLQTGAALEEMRVHTEGLSARLAAMIAYICDLYDQDAALFRFLLLSQHDFLHRLEQNSRTPVDVLVTTLAEAVAAGEIPSQDPAAAAAAVMGIVLQTAVFHLYGRLSSPLSQQAPRLIQGALAAVAAMGAA